MFVIVASSLFGVLLDNPPAAGANAFNPGVALILSGMFVFSVLQLSRVSPFLYFQF